MTSAKFPHRLDMFQSKVNARFAGDPNGDYVMAEDINELQDAIMAIERTLGINPQGNNLSVGERVSRLEGSPILKAPPTLVYLGSPARINGATTTRQAATEFLRFDHVIMSNIEEATPIVREVHKTRDVKVYGYIDTGVTTLNLSISQIQVQIQSWKDIGATGIYCGNFGFERGVSRERQNIILDSIHEHEMVAILQAANPDEVFSDVFHETMNPNWVHPKIVRGDTYHFEKFIVDSGTANKYTNLDNTLETLERLHDHRVNLGIRIIATPEIRSNVSEAEAQEFYEYAHAFALLAALDGYYPTVEGYGASINTVNQYGSFTIIGDWYVESPTISRVGDTYKRKTSFGEIVINAQTKKSEFTGLYIPFEQLRIAANTIDGSLMKDSSIPDRKISSYDGGRLIDAINTNVTRRIHVSKVSGLTYDDVDGDIPQGVLEANIINAINANIGKAVIDSAVIGDLTAEHIKTGSLRANLIEASVIEAINANIGHATIDSAVIGSLKAHHIQASVVEALNLYARNIEVGSAIIDSALIGVIHADKIQAGDITAERMEANVINAINTYTESLVADKAIIKAAAIAQLTSHHIQASVIEAINLYTRSAVIDKAVIDSAAIGDLSVNNLKANVIEAINANIDLATINGAVIQRGTVGRMQIQDGAITNLLVNDISASKLNAGVINTALVKISGDNGHLQLSGNRLQVFDIQNHIPYERVSIGDVNNDGTAFGFRVRGADGTTVLYDETGVYNEGITDGAITNPKIGDNAVDGRVIAADAVFARHIVADEIKGKHIAADEITGHHIFAGSITSAHAVFAEGAIGAADIAKAIITDAHIHSLNADKIDAGKIKAKFVEISSESTFADGYDPTKVDSSIRTDLRLTSPLPTSIKMDSTGITATTTGDLTKFARLDHRGLYISGGAIVIDGGLSRDNISDEVADGWDAAARYRKEMSDDNLLTDAEKASLKREWEGYVSENISIMGQTNHYWPNGTGAPASRQTYIDKYSALNTFLNVSNDLNNNKPILHPDNMSKTSQINGSLLDTRLLEYKDARNALVQDISIRAKDLSEDVRQKVGEIENNIVYKIEIRSSSGLVFKNGDIQTVLEARIYHGATDITSAVPSDKIIWTRQSSDEAGDILWNNTRGIGVKSVVVTRDDIYQRATFSCKLIE